MEPGVRREDHVDPPARRCRARDTNPTTRKAAPIPRKARCPELPIAMNAAPSAMNTIPGAPGRFISSPPLDRERPTPCGSPASAAERSEAAGVACWALSALAAPDQSLGVRITVRSFGGHSQVPAQRNSCTSSLRSGRPGRSFYGTALSSQQNSASPAIDPSTTHKERADV